LLKLKKYDNTYVSDTQRKIQMSDISQESVHAEEIRQIWALFRETDRERKEGYRELLELFKKTEKKVNDLTGKWGRFVEGMIAPGVERLFEERNIRVNTVYQHVRRRKDGKEIEIDILAIDGEYAVLIEAKSTLGTEDVREHLDRIGKFRTFFHEYADRSIVGAVAGIVIEENADRFAYKNGLFVIAQSGEAVKILNDSKFKPKQW
jgi:hypothetical protein